MEQRKESDWETFEVSVVRYFSFEEEKKGRLVSQHSMLLIELLEKCGSAEANEGEWKDRAVKYLSIRKSRNI